MRLPDDDLRFQEVRKAAKQLVHEWDSGLGTEEHEEWLARAVGESAARQVAEAIETISIFLVEG